MLKIHKLYRFQYKYIDLFSQEREENISKGKFSEVTWHSYEEHTNNNTMIFML